MENLKQIINLVLTNRDRKTLAEITPEMRLRDDLGLDSLDLAELTVRIESEYGVDVFENGLVSTVAEIMDIISNAK